MQTRIFLFCLKLMYILILSVHIIQICADMHEFVNCVRIIEDKHKAHYAINKNFINFTHSFLEYL